MARSQPKVPSAKPWVTDERDRTYINVRWQRLAELDKERKKLHHQIERREERVWYAGGRERYLADEHLWQCPTCRGGFKCAMAVQQAAG